jgi:type I restriction enzyme, S subunit
MSVTLQWAERLPSSWAAIPLKAIARYFVSNVDKISAEDELPVRLCNYTDVYNNEFITPQLELMRSTATPGEITRFQLKEHDVVITKDSESWDDIAIPALVVETSEDLVCGYHLAIIRPDQTRILGRFLFRCLQSKALRLPLELASTGVTRYGLPKEEIGKFRLPVPSVKIQQNIADYLDVETRQIDTLISEKQTMLGLLEEKRAAVDARTVTNGLTGRARLKASGVEWLNNIPAHWELKRGKRLFREIDEQTKTGEETLLSLRMERGLVPHNDVSEKPIPAENLIGYKIARPNEIVLNRMRAASGLVAVTPQHGIVSPDYAVFRAFDGVDPEYFTLLFKTPLLQAVFRSLSKGLGTGQSGFLRLYSEDFLSIKMPVPPLDEQKAIVAQLARERARSADIEETLEESIKLLKERRAALITAAVTGQIKPETMSA